MKFEKHLTILFVLSIISVAVFVVTNQTKAEPDPYDLVIKGLVDNPVNFTYSELQSFPMVSEVAFIQCIGDLEGNWIETYNWTGIPLSFLLSTTGVASGAMEVVFYAHDGFSSSLTIERALHPTTLLGLQANGTVLSPTNGHPYRLVIPCKYGYKWVKKITEIEVVDYDYKGTFESAGFSDEADIPNCILPSTTPPLENSDIVLGCTAHSVTTLSNSTISSLDFDVLQKQICFNVTGPSLTTGYCYITIPKRLLKCNSSEQWQVWANNTLVEDRKVIETINYAHIYFNYSHTTKNVKIVGTVAPPSISDINGDSEVDVMDVLIVGLAFGSKPGDPNWNPIADLYLDEEIDVMDVLTVTIYFAARW